MEKKGIYPYEYTNSFKRFKEDCLPDNDCFSNSLKDCNVWKVFEIKYLGEYHDLYLKTDVLLFCDMFEKFIDVCLKDYGLDPCHYYSSPGLSWDEMLKMTVIKLDKFKRVGLRLGLDPTSPK